MAEITRLGNKQVIGKVGAAYTYLNLLSIKGPHICQACNISIYNSHAAQTLSGYIGIRRGGKLFIFDSFATVAALTVYNCSVDLYLHSGDDLLLIILGSGANTGFTASFQLLDVGESYNE